MDLKHFEISAISNLSLFSQLTLSLNGENTHRKIERCFRVSRKVDVVWRIRKKLKGFWVAKWFYHINPIIIGDKKNHRKICLKRL